MSVCAWCGEGGELSLFAPRSAPGVRYEAHEGCEQLAPIGGIGVEPATGATRAVRRHAVLLNGRPNQKKYDAARSGLVDFGREIGAKLIRIEWQHFPGEVAKTAYAGVYAEGSPL